ncbi:2-C-methyl-D-erythritol 4-phosphate cytidylyltransferase [Pseudobythopirellula maris]|uniref:2-C-methyl-D-erythritol 4-phosphate cytidylyltransferase n=1 Tax=Pseudobythopirellula maris TaxID=2527991 RepID=A0A5C5ZTM7_9BACT|nr:2-C-methyl-D-erythritol 4-phosphate cytidylyltransferase [Pseudobythopirellula maris]TWT90566.1 2-C-methyl-D-erythritol 4-phosphate cytidylyltransferase [Pseudobythopirellula maris]
MSDTPKPRFAVILVAAGRSERFADANYKKPFAPLCDRAVWLHSAERFMERDDVCQVVVVIAEEDREDFQRRFGPNLAFMSVEVCVGGANRGDSVRAGLAKLTDGATHVAVHDAARPCVADKEIDAVFAAASRDGAAILAARVADTIKRAKAPADGGKPSIEETVPRDGLWAAQTPQVFCRKLLERAHEAAGEGETDDAQLIERLGEPVTLVEGSPMNLKITKRMDLKLAELILKARPPKDPAGGFANPFAGDDMWR